MRRRGQNSTSSSKCCMHPTSKEKMRVRGIQKAKNGQ